ncbi:hypothetical protein IPA_04920 [Ignicoccus pacificus DSM 13166]|uniref:Uncharacterized protein n=1 Tax=Ignicoccus pacificus DSM 13166 TaxID=940294 RepID=A0A977KCN0_9CREN|nr:hypothetical protein IPA_04920 [Ignicoccus pacificus DSM 13166]
MTKNPSADEMIAPSPLGALFCYFIELSVALVLIFSDNPTLPLLFSSLDFTIVRAFTLMYLVLTHKVNITLTLLPLISWSYHIIKEKGLCYPLLVGLKCCRSGGKPWIYILIRED